MRSSNLNMPRCRRPSRQKDVAAWTKQLGKHIFPLNNWGNTFFPNCLVFERSAQVDSNGDGRIEYTEPCQRCQLHSFAHLVRGYLKGALKSDHLELQNAWGFLENQVWPLQGSKL